MLVRSATLLVLCALVGAQSASADSALDQLKELYRRPNTVPFPASAPYSPQMATLGKMLFFDARLSGSHNISCASCHNPSFGYEMPVEGSIGNANSRLPRQAPTLLNAAWLPILFWDGRADTLESQADGPITATGEMNGKFEKIVPRLKAVYEYKMWFDKLFPGEGISKASILTAIATYERSIVSGWAPFDRWIEGDEIAISENAKRGFAVFNGPGGCSNCHVGWNFTDNKFHDTGLPSEDIGRGSFERDNPKARYAFKTPGLRNETYRAPYMHDGLLPDLQSVIAHYESGGIDRPSRERELMKPISLSAEQRSDLIEFLRSLTAEKSETSLPNLPN
jgi:cytochrome c peroxidase